MDKKIILSLVIVALIGIVAATYQINVNDDTLNPLASVATEDTPVTDTLSAPAQAQESGQAQPQDQSQPAEAQAQTTGEQAQPTEDQQSTAPATKTVTTTSNKQLITSDNPVVSSGRGNNEPQSSNSPQRPDNTGTQNSDNAGTQSSDNSGTQNQDNSGAQSPDNSGTQNSNNAETQKPDDDNSPEILTTLIQAYTYISRQPTGTVIDQSSGTLEERPDGEYYVFEARSIKNNELVHIYVPRDLSKGNTWFILEDGTGPDNAPPYDPGF